MDWIIEAVVENLELKRALLKKLKPSASPEPSSRPIPADCRWQRSPKDFPRISAALGSARTFSIRRATCVCWKLFPRLIPTALASMRSPGSVTSVSAKASCMAKDTPNFIGNRIGTFSVLNVMRLMQEMDLTIEDVDALTGQAVGWPKSATFRTIDLVGLDILGHVVCNMATNVRDERSDLKLPDFYKQMLERKMAGRQNQRRLLQEGERRQG